MLPGVRRRIALVPIVLGLVLRVAVPVLATGEPPEQTVTPIPAQKEQRVEAIAVPAEQRVEQLAGDGMQSVSGGSKSGVRRTFDGVTKVVVGVAAAGISIGAMVASLLFL
jgi:hypothetical protein